MTLPVGVYLPGVSGEYISTPDHADLDITGDMCLVAHIALDDWVPSTGDGSKDNVFVSKFGTAPIDQAYIFSLKDNGSGALRVGVKDASGYVECVSSAAPAVSDGEPLWVAATVDLNNGASDGSATFWTSSDGIAWAQLGDVVLFGRVMGPIATTAYPVAVGAHTAGTLDRLAGTVYKAQVFDGIGDNTAPGQGTLVAEFNPLLPVEPRYRDSTGKIWTMNGSAWAFEGAAS